MVRGLSPPNTRLRHVSSWATRGLRLDLIIFSTAQRAPPRSEAASPKPRGRPHSAPTVTAPVRASYQSLRQPEGGNGALDSKSLIHGTNCSHVSGRTAKHWSERGDSNSRPLAPEVRRLQGLPCISTVSLSWSRDILVTGPKLARAECHWPHRNPPKSHCLSRRLARAATSRPLIHRGILTGGPLRMRCSTPELLRLSCTFPPDLPETGPTTTSLMSPSSAPTAPDR